ncbi:hypothetical protein CBL_11974 [Carabus blaptoides fortunei]
MNSRDPPSTDQMNHCEKKIFVFDYLSLFCVVCTPRHNEQLQRIVSFPARFVCLLVLLVDNAKSYESVQVASRHKANTQSERARFEKLRPQRSEGYYWPRPRTKVDQTPTHNQVYIVETNAMYL